MIKIGSNKIGTRRKRSVPRRRGEASSPRRYSLSEIKSRKYVKIIRYT